jgi:hypothetical protein
MEWKRPRRRLVRVRSPLSAFPVTRPIVGTRIDCQWVRSALKPQTTSRSLISMRCKGMTLEMPLFWLLLSERGAWVLSLRLPRRS